MYITSANKECNRNEGVTLNLKLYHLKVQACKLYSNKYMVASTQITNTKIFAFVAVLVFKLLSGKVLSI